MFIAYSLYITVNHKVCEYDQELQQPHTHTHTADQPTAPRGRVTEHYCSIFKLVIAHCSEFVTLSWRLRLNPTNIRNYFLPFSLLNHKTSQMGWKIYISPQVKTFIDLDDSGGGGGGGGTRGLCEIGAYKRVPRSTCQYWNLSYLKSRNNTVKIQTTSLHLF